MNRLQKIKHLYSLHFMGMPAAMKWIMPLLFIGFYAMWLSITNTSLGKPIWTNIRNDMPLISMIYILITATQMSWGFTTKRNKANYAGFFSSGFHSFLDRQPVSRNEIFVSKTLVFMTISSIFIICPTSMFIHSQDITIRPNGDAQEILNNTYLHYFSEAELIQSDDKPGMEIYLQYGRIPIGLYACAEALTICIVVFWTAVAARKNVKLWFIVGTLLLLYFIGLPLLPLLQNTALAILSIDYQQRLFWYIDYQPFIWLAIIAMMVAVCFDAKRRFLTDI